MADPRPHIIATNISSLCSILNRPALMTGVLRDILIRHFQENLIETHELRQLIWQNNANTSILIESIHKWTPQTTEHRPAVIIKRNAFTNQRASFEDRMLGGFEDGTDQFVTFWAGSHTLFCLGSTGAQCELLATEVQHELTEFGPVIRRTLDLQRFQVVSIGAISKLEESAETFVVPVTVGCAFTENWIVKPHAPELTQISLSILLDS